MRIRTWVALIILIFLSQSLRAQYSKILILEKLGSKKRITYTLGDQIILMLKSSNIEIREEITDIGDSIITLSNGTVNIHDIKYVKTTRTHGFLSPGNGPKLIMAGATLFLIDIINHSIIQGEEFRISKGVAIASASLIGVGAIMMTMKHRKFKPGKNKRIRTFVL